MNKLTIAASTALALSAAALLAKNASQAGGPPDGQRPPPPPIIAALDANGDGVIDATEIANAPAALKTLDKNGDGKLTADELRPPRPEGQAGDNPPPPAAARWRQRPSATSIHDAARSRTRHQR